MSTTFETRTWDWESDGELVGCYQETRVIVPRTGPSKGKRKSVIEFTVGEESVSVFPPKVLARMLREELTLRKAGDFPAGERMTITPKGKRDGANGPYWDFADVMFEHPAPRPTAADKLAIGMDDESTDGIRDVPIDTSGFEPAPSIQDRAEEAYSDDDIPF